MRRKSQRRKRNKRKENKGKKKKEKIEKSKNKRIFEDKFDCLNKEQKQRVVNLTIDEVLLNIKNKRYSYHGYAFDNEIKNTSNRDK